MAAKRGGKRGKKGRQAKRGTPASRRVSASRPNLEEKSKASNTSSVHDAADILPESDRVPLADEMSTLSDADDVVPNPPSTSEENPAESIPNTPILASTTNVNMPVPSAEELSDLPVPDESVFKLPEQPGGARGLRRRRRARGSDFAKAAAAAAQEADSGAPLPETEITRLTSAYRTGSEGRDELVERIERDPDYMFRGGNAEGEYGLAAAIIGTGKPNKQGVYVLPYLQSSHMILLGVILLGTFVYYPGFPLTEGSEELRETLRKVLALVFTVNFALAVYSYAEAKKRGQPPLFWFFKVALLGNIALQELRGNVPVTVKDEQNSKRKERR